jgi:hypothetical protein|nr:MAG TPA: hypothetical protein [Caudoviricetes sp.]
MLDEKLREKMLERVFATINPKIEIKISSDGNKTKVKLEGSKLALLMALESTKTKLIKDENIPKEIVDEIKNITEKEIEKNGN